LGDAQSLPARHSGGGFCRPGCRNYLWSAKPSSVRSWLDSRTCDQAAFDIWCDLSSDEPDDTAALRRAIEAIDRLVPSLIADYFMDAEVPVADVTLLDRYFAHLKA
jgi:hypothetical protein